MTFDQDAEAIWFLTQTPPTDGFKVKGVAPDLDQKEMALPRLWSGPYLTWFGHPPIHASAWYSSSVMNWPPVISLAIILRFASKVSSTSMG